MELRQFLPGGKGSNIIAGEQGVVYAVQMGSNDGGVRCFFADYFYVIQIHNQAAHGHGRLTAVEDDHIRVVGINGLRHAVKIYSVPGKVQRSVLVLPGSGTTSSPRPATHSHWIHQDTPQFPGCPHVGRAPS